MNLKEGMLLFHGSYTPVEKIDLGMCANAKDFGKGFYLTSDLQQAKGFVKSSVIKAQRHHLADADQDFGFISSFRFHFHRDDLRIHTFQEADRDWLWFIAKNRRGVMFSEFWNSLYYKLMSSSITAFELQAIMIPGRPKI